MAWHGSIGRAQASTGGRERFADLEYVCTVSQVWRAINASLLAYCSRCKALGSFLGKAERNPQRKVEGKERNGWAEDEGKRDKGKQGQARSQQAEAAFSPMPHARGEWERQEAAQAMWRRAAGKSVVLSFSISCRKRRVATRVHFLGRYTSAVVDTGSQFSHLADALMSIVDLCEF